MKKRTGATLLLFLLSIGIASCTLQSRTTPTVISQEAQVNTVAAKTISALSTELAAGRNATVGAPPTATVTPRPTEPATQPSATGAPPTDAPAVTPGGTETPCNRAEFVRDVTIPDNSTILPNSVFTKTWELKNTGTCAWNNTYAVIYVGKGSSMSGPAAQPLVGSGEIKPGETARVSVPLRAPGEPGEYSGYWMLRSGDGKAFGTGPNSGAPFYVQIQVASTYSFAEHTCSAQWTNGSANLPCPGTEGSSEGVVIPLENPTLENNEKQEGLGILTAAQAVANGYIAGKYEPVMVPAGSDFRATLSCQAGATGCYVRFKVTYRVDNGDEQILGEWNEGYEGGVTNAIKDLDMVAGRSVAFIFYVYVSGDPAQSKGVWFNPRIVQ